MQVFSVTVFPCVSISHRYRSISEEFMTLFLMPDSYLHTLEGASQYPEIGEGRIWISKTLICVLNTQHR